MKFVALIASFFLSLNAFALSPYPFEEVEDLSNLPLLNPEFSQMKTAKLRFQNGLELLLLSDPNADQSAASVAVEVGSWNDPEEYPGMAHFCEHMLFMGTEKYPNENEFFSELTNFKGMTNAHTSPHRTVYMFSCQTTGFLPLLDRFGHFFIDPLFNPSNISREIHAVDQEFAKSLENDLWRSHMVWKETGNQKHPNRLFSCGNSQTLAHIPQTVLKNWYRQHYGASRIHVVIYSSLPIETLKEKAMDLFSAVPDAKATSVDSEESLSSQEQRGHITYIQPIQNRQVLMLSWELPLALADEPSHAADLLAYALNRGQKYSLAEKLKKEELVDAVSIQIENAADNTHRFFQISFELTEKGIDHIPTIGLRAFQALATLRSTGIPSYLFEEKNQIAKLNFQYQSRQEAFSLIEKLGCTLPDEPLATYPRKQLLAENYQSEKIVSLLSLLKPSNCAVTLLAPFEKTKIKAEKKEKWMGAEYAIRTIPDAWKNSWANAKPHPEIRLPEPNPFLPTDLRVFSEKPLSTTPLLISKGEFGVAYYARCPEYQIPEASIRLHILSPVINPTPESQVLSALYIDHLTDLLQPTLKAAASAGLDTVFKLERSRLHLFLFGFNEKAPLLLQEVLRQMPLNPPTPEQFAIYFDRHQKLYANAEKELAYKQGKELLDSLLNQDKTTSKEKLLALESISYEDFLEFHEKLLEKTSFEALFSGNLSLKEAESAWLDIVHSLGKTPYPKAEQSQTKVLHLPAENGPFSIHQTTQVQGNATFLVIEEGDFSFEKKAAQEILSNALKEAFFNELRTRQKTGYIAVSDGTDIEGRLFQFFLVQSNSHQPEDLLYRFELFLEEYLQDFSTLISSERFDLMKASTILDLKNRTRNLKDKSAFWDLLAFEKRADFSYLNYRIEGLEALSYEAFSKQAKEFLSRANRKRLAILIEGKLSSPFAFEPLTPTELQEVADYVPKLEEDNSEEIAL